MGMWQINFSIIGLISFEIFNLPNECFGDKLHFILLK